VIRYEMIVNYTGVNKKSGRAVSGVSARIRGDGWFVDDNLKTADLRNR
jgi:hypothetical protein